MDCYSRWRRVDNIRWNSCYKCGFLFNTRHLRFCKAKNARCFRCGRLGHYARCCWSEIVQNHNVNYPRTPQINHIVVNKGKRKRKSWKQKARDKQRLTKYLDKKKCMQNLPFSKIGEKDFQQVFNLNSKNADLELLSDKVERLKQEKITLKVQLKENAAVNLQLEKNLANTTEELKTTKNSLDRCNKENIHSRHIVKHLQEQRNDQLKITEELNDDIFGLRIENERLSEKLDLVFEENMNFTIEIDGLKQKIKTLQQKCSNDAPGTQMTRHQPYTPYVNSDGKPVHVISSEALSSPNVHLKDPEWLQYTQSRIIFK